MQQSFVCIREGTEYITVRRHRCPITVHSRSGRKGEGTRSFDRPCVRVRDRFSLRADPPRGRAARPRDHRSVGELNIYTLQNWSSPIFPLDHDDTASHELDEARAGNTSMIDTKDDD